MWNMHFSPAVDPLAKEREAPMPVLPLDAPFFIPGSAVVNPIDKAAADRLKRRISKIKTFHDITPADIEYFNIQLREDVPLEDMIRGEEGRERPFKHDDALTAALNEIVTPNYTAIRTILRLPLENGEVRPKLKDTYLFFKQLEHVCQYWDDSMDNYYEVPSAPSNVDLLTPLPPSGTRTSPGEEHNTDSIPIRVEKPIATTKQMYKGLRIASGYQMETSSLVNLVKSFVDLCRQPFNIAPGSNPARLVVQGFRTPIGLTCDVGAIHHDRQMARSGVIGGPVMGIHVRDTLLRRNAVSEEADKQAKLLDFYQEMGALLLVAQKRSRHRQKAYRPGKGKWWAEKPRWGGGPGGNLMWESDEEPWHDTRKAMKGSEAHEGQEEEAMSPEASKPQELSRAPSSSASKPNSTGMITPKKRTKSSARPAAADKKTKKSKLSAERREIIRKYKTVQPGPAQWDKKVVYRQIGRRDVFDDVYLLSAINSHISFLHLRVHKNYMNWLEFGHAVPDSYLIEDQSLHEEGLMENILYVERSRWFNMVMVEDRMEALVGLWRMMNFMFRDGEGVVETDFGTLEDKRFELRKARAGTAIGRVPVAPEEEQVDDDDE